jgi:putative ubiquitin-RnfH superfamily antitoxin RatB of RatAB toxin-antitoxin module
MESVEKNAAADLIMVEVAYALPERQRILRVSVPAGTTALQAAQLSGITQEFPDIDLATAAMGIFSKNLDGKLLPLPTDYVLKPRERVEIYRPLQADPKAAHTQRAARLKDKQKAEQRAEKVQGEQQDGASSTEDAG